MSVYVMDLPAILEEDYDVAGRKAANLASLYSAGFPVLTGFCLTTAAFRQALAPLSERIAAVLSRGELTEPERAADVAGTIQSLLGALRIPEDAADQLDAAAAQLGDARLAVRSSGTVEDLAGASLAGQYETVLGVLDLQALHTAVLTCWRSFYNAHAIAARASAGLGEGGGMAVLVQPMIEADCAGVCYSIGPEEGRRDLIVISGTWGLGAGVVDGSVPGDTYWLRRQTLETERRHIAEKTEQLVASDGGIRRTEVAAERRRAACLPDSWAARVAEAAVLTEQHFGAPQDVEWAIVGQKLWVLQSRPIAGPAGHLQRAERFPITWNSPGDERRCWRLWWEGRGRVPLPLEQDYRDLLVPLAWEDASRFVGADHFSDRMIVNGRRYQARRTGVLQPGDMRVRSQAMEQMQERLLQEYGLTGWDIWGPEIVARTRQLHDFDHRGASDADLATHLEDAMGAYRRHWMLHSPIMFSSPETYFRAYAALTGKPEASIREEAWVLAQGLPTVETELVDELYALGVDAREHPEVAALVRTPPDNAREQLVRMARAQRFLSRLDAFLDRFGERNGTGRGSIVSLRNPTWQEDIKVVLAMTAPYLDPEVPAPATARARVEAERESQIERLYAACADPEIVAEFRRQLEPARRMAQLSETHNHYIDQLADGQLRLATLEAGRRLASKGVIEQPDDVWWLRSGEILQELRASQRSSYAGVVRARRAQHARWEELTPPPVLGAPEQDLPCRSALTDEVEETAVEEGIIRGHAGSKGCGRGPARLIAMGETAPSLQPGDVLVAVNAGPAWTPYFPILAGVVLDEGVLGEHSIAIAREYGIPLVFGTRDASRRIQDGSMITVDGTAGAVVSDS